MLSTICAQGGHHSLCHAPPQVFSPFLRKLTFSIENSASASLHQGEECLGPGLSLAAAVMKDRDLNSVPPFSCPWSSLPCPASYLESAYVTKYLTFPSSPLNCDGPPASTLSLLKLGGRASLSPPPAWSEPRISHVPWQSLRGGFGKRTWQ